MESCHKCRDNIRKLQQRLRCCMCNGNFHRKCIPGVSQDQYRQWKKHDILESWNCPDCLNQPVPMSAEPSIYVIEELQNITVKRGRTIQFCCTINKCGETPIWRHMGRLVMPSPRIAVISMGSEHELCVSEATPEDVGIYTVQFGDVKSVASVTVQEPLVFRLPLTDVEVDECKEINLRCKVSERDLTPTWCHCGVPVTPSDRVMFISAGNDHRLSIREATTVDEGSYEVKLGGVVSRADVTVRVSVQFTEKLHCVKIREKQSLQLCCKINKAGETPVWRHDDILVTPGSRVKVVSMGTEHGLSIQEAARIDGGVYTVMFGKVISMAEVSVKKALAFKQTLATLVDSNRMIKLQCEISEHDQTPVWYHRDCVVIPGPRVTIASMGGCHRLCISGATSDDKGVYTVEFEELKSTAIVTVKCPELVQFTAKLQDMNIFQNTMLTLVCAVSKPDLKPVWRHDSILVAPGPKVRIVSRGLQHWLLITGVTPDNAGKYSVAFGSLNSVSVVTVEDTFGCCELHGAESKSENTVLKETTMIANPFYNVLAKLIPLQPLVKKLSFVLLPTQISSLQNSGKANKPVSVHMRLCRNSKTCEQADDFPDSMIVTVNNQWAQLRESHVIGAKVPLAKPVDISKLCHHRSYTMNNVDIRWTKPIAHCISVNVVEKQTADELLEKMKEEQTIHRSHTVDLVKEKLKVDEDNDVATTSLMASLTCPISKVRLSVPCRGADCKHIQCVDALGVLKMNERKPKWRCDICQSPTPLHRLRIDGLFQEILSSVGKDVSEVVFEDDGSWHAKTANDSIMDLDADVNRTLSEKMDMIDLTELSDDEEAVPAKKEKIPLRTNTDLLNKVMSSVSQAPVSRAQNKSRCHGISTSSRRDHESSQNDQTSSRRDDRGSSTRRERGNSSIEDFFQPSSHNNCYRSRENNRNTSRNIPYRNQDRYNNNRSRYHGNQGSNSDNDNRGYDYYSYDYTNYWTPQITSANIRA